MYRCVLIFLSVVALVVGESATIKDLPYKVSIFIEGSYSCAGVILSQKVVLTTAGCTAHRKILKYLVKYGDTNRNQGKEVGIQRFLEHPQSNWQTPDNDLALLFLADSIIYGHSAQPITLPTKTPAAGSAAQITGWGELNTLHKANVAVSDLNVCSILKNGKLSNNNLCVSGSTKSCADNSGETLVNGKQLLGIVMKRNNCENGKYIGEFTNIAQYRDWIIQNAKL